MQEVLNIIEKYKIFFENIIIFFIALIVKDFIIKVVMKKDQNILDFTKEKIVEILKFFLYGILLFLLYYFFGYYPFIIFIGVLILLILIVEVWKGTEEERLIGIKYIIWLLCMSTIIYCVVVFF